LPSGEVGTLVRVNHSSGIAGPPHCILVIEWNQREYCGSLYFDNEASMQRIVAVLQGHIGRPLTEVGSLEIPDFPV
jgi:hypothetical protein